MVDVTCVVSCHGIPPDAEIADLKNHFAPAGSVESVLVVRESHSNLCTGRGYIIYSNASAAAKALSQLNGSEFLGDASNKLKLLIPNMLLR